MTPIVFVFLFVFVVVSVFVLVFYQCWGTKSWRWGIHFSTQLNQIRAIYLRHMCVSLMDGACNSQLKYMWVIQHSTVGQHEKTEIGDLL